MKQRKLATRRDASQWVYDGTWRGRERHLRYNHSDKGRERTARYEATPRRRAARMAREKYGLPLAFFDDLVANVGLDGLNAYPDIANVLAGSH